MLECLLYIHNNAPRVLYRYSSQHVKKNKKKHYNNSILKIMVVTMVMLESNVPSWFNIQQMLLVSRNYNKLA